MSLLIPNNMTLKEIERFMDAKRKREAKAREEAKRKRDQWLEDKAGIEA
jgi:hypothetical protein